MAHGWFRGCDCDRHHQVRCVGQLHPKYAFQNGIRDKFLKCVAGMAVREDFFRWRWFVIELACKGPAKGAIELQASTPLITKHKMSSTLDSGEISFHYSIWLCSSPGTNCAGSLKISSLGLARTCVLDSKRGGGPGPTIRRLSLTSTSTSNTDTTHLRIVPIPNIVLTMRSRLSLGLQMDFGSRHFRSRTTFGSREVILLNPPLVSKCLFWKEFTLIIRY